MWRILPPVEKAIMEIPVKEGPREDLGPGASCGLCVLFNARHSRPGKYADGRLPPAQENSSLRSTGWQEVF